MSGFQGVQGRAESGGASSTASSCAETQRQLRRGSRPCRSLGGAAGKLSARPGSAPAPARLARSRWKGSPAEGAAGPWSSGFPLPDL